MFDKILKSGDFQKPFVRGLDFLTQALGLRIRVLSIVIFCGSILLTVKLSHLWLILNTEPQATMIEVSPAHASKSLSLQDDPPAPAAPLSAATDAPDKTSDVQMAEVDKKKDTSLKKLDTEAMTAEQFKVLEQINAIKPLQEENSSQAVTDKEATLKAIESKIDEKIKKLETTRSNLESLVKKVDEKDKVNIDRLVKMAEAMKPEEAAPMLEKLDLQILIEIMEAIKPAKGAAVLTKMEPDKAGFLMNELAKRKKLVKAQETGLQ